jgi:hypothetical protein
MLLEICIRARPHLDAGAVAGVAHGNVVDEQILDNVSHVDVLAKRTDTNAVGAVADKALNNNIGAIGLEGNAVCFVSDLKAHLGT